MGKGEFQMCVTGTDGNLGWDDISLFLTIELVDFCVLNQESQV